MLHSMCVVSELTIFAYVNRCGNMIIFQIYTLLANGCVRECVCVCVWVYVCVCVSYTIATQMHLKH